MQRSEGVRRKQEAGGKRIRRKKRRVENQGQLVLLCGGGKQSEKERERNQGVRQYEDPSPEGILIGREDLRSFLESRGESGAIRIRELLRGLELKGFHKPAPKAGRRPYHPAALLGLILFGILEGRHSLRQLETLARTDVRCWWITGGIHPDHSVIGRFIQRYGDQLSEGFFMELTRRVLELTKGSGGDLSGDGTLVQAAGSRYRRLSKEAAETAEQEAEEAHLQAPQDPILGGGRDRTSTDTSAKASWHPGKGRSQSQRTGSGGAAVEEQSRVGSQL